MLFIVLGILSFIVSLVIPVAIILVIIRLVTGRKGAGHSSSNGGGLMMSVDSLSPRQVMLVVLASSAALSGVSGLYVMPTWLFGLTSDSAVFAVQLVSGALVLAAGVAVLKERLVSGLLMSVGVITILASTPYVFANLGSKGILLVIFLVLMALIWLTVWLSKRSNQS